MGNGVATTSLPDGAAGEVLAKMAGPTRIAITDKFWFELVKVQLPGVEQLGFFDAHYKDPAALNALIKDAYFLQLVATNEQSGNFRTFLRFWARLLHYYRTSPRDAKPCTATAVLSLSLLCRCLLKQFTGTFALPELLFQVEQTPYEPASEKDQPTDGALLVSYCGKRALARLPAPGAPWAGTRSPAAACLEPLAAAAPEDQGILRDAARCALRAVAAGETFAAVDVADRAAEAGMQELVACPAGVPASRSSVVRSAFRELCDFLVSSSFGAVSGASPSTNCGDAGEGKPAPRNLSSAPQTMQLQAVLLEILLTLTAVAAPHYAPPPMTGPATAAEDFCAPFLLTARAKQAVAQAAWEKLLPKPPNGSAAAVEKPEPGSVSKRLDFEAKGGDAEEQDAEHVPSLPTPPGPDQPVLLPILTALVEVLDEERDGYECAAKAPTMSPRAAVLHGEEDEAPSSEKGSHGCKRAEALLASLLNCVWLEPHAASLPRPTESVLRLLSGISPPSGKEAVDAAIDVLPPKADHKAAARAATTAAERLAARALLVLLLVLFHEPQANPGVVRAFVNLSDPAVDAKPVHNGAAAPVNFAQLLKVVLARLREDNYALLLYNLVLKNASFRLHCLCRADPDEVLVPILEALGRFPKAASGGGPVPALEPATALLLTLLTLSGDRSFCEGASRTRLAHAGRVLGTSRPVRDVALSSLLVVVLLRLAHWNFAAHRDPFFNQAVGGVLANLAAHGVEQLHWTATEKMLEMAKLLIRNHLKSAGNGAAAEEDAAAAEARAAEARRSRMVRDLLRSLLRLLSSCLRAPRAAKNTALAYDLQRAYPTQFDELGSDADLGPPLEHIKAAAAYFQAQCPPEEDGGSGRDAQLARLEEAASRLPGMVDAVAALASAGQAGFAYAETAGASAYFLPVVWEQARSLIPDHVCWSTPASR